MKVLVVIVGLACSTLSYGQPARSSDADQRYAAAETLFANKQYLDAAREFEQAYQLDPDPAILFNIAQAYRLGRACAQASRYYHRFSQQVPNPPDPDKLARYTAEMDECAKRESEATEPRVVHDTKIVHQTTVVGERDPGRRMRLAGIGTVGLGIVGLALGAYFTYDVHHIETERDDVCSAGCVWGDQVARVDALDQRGHRAEILEAISYGSAGVAIATGVTLYVLGRRAPAGEQLTAVPVRGGALATFGVRF